MIVPTGTPFYMTENDVGDFLGDFRSICRDMPDGHVSKTLHRVEKVKTQEHYGEILRALSVVRSVSGEILAKYCFSTINFVTFFGIPAAEPKTPRDVAEELFPKLENAWSGVDGWGPV